MPRYRRRGVAPVPEMILRGNPRAGAASKQNIRRPLLRLALVPTLALGCGVRDDPPPAPAPPGPPPPAKVAARPVEPAAPAPELAAAPEESGPAIDLLRKYECNRCHAGAGLEPASADRDCVGCHQEILAGEVEAPAPAVARWQGNLRSLVAAPSLDGVGRKLTRAWVQDHLLAPTEVRPRLPATMPRLAITSPEAARLAAHLVPAESKPVTFDPARVAPGRALFEELGCAACHLFSGAAIAARATHQAGGAPVEPTATAALLAPDLRHTRDRFQPGALVGWLQAPEAVTPGTLMPTFALGAEAARDLATFLVLAPLDPVAPRPIPARLPLLERPVGFDEVASTLLRPVCWHCHASADYARGDGGPGNSGGFGFAPRGVDLSSYVGIQSGAIGDDGRRTSVLAPAEAGIPRIIAVLLARHAEVAGAPVPGIRGMPLGLPPVPMEQIQLLDTWIAQGRRR